MEEEIKVKGISPRDIFKAELKELDKLNTLVDKLNNKIAQPNKIYYSVSYDVNFDDYSLVCNKVNRRWRNVGTSAEIRLRLEEILDYIEDVVR